MVQLQVSCKKKLMYHIINFLYVYFVDAILILSLMKKDGQTYVAICKVKKSTQFNVLLN